MNRPPDKILVFRIGQIGDTVAALPCLWVIRKQFPDASIVVLSEIPTKNNHLPPEAVLPVSGLVDGFEKYPGGASVKNFFVAWRQLRQLRQQGFSTLVYLTPSSRTPKQRLRDQFFFRLCGIKYFLATKGFAETLQPRLEDGTLARLPREADALLGRLKCDGLPVPAHGKGCMDLQITEQEKTRVENWWKQNIGSQAVSNGWIAICIGGKTSTQCWPVERYAEVVCKLIEVHGLYPVIIGGKEDREAGIKLLDKWNTGLCAAGELTVRESVALMEKARFYLGNDTGVMHLAAAVSLPCIGVFSGRNPPGIWEPYGSGHKVLRFEVPCAGCHLAFCNRELQCLTNISVEQVYAACVEVLHRVTSSVDPNLSRKI
jgi:heptosyltransferase-3